MPQEDRNRNDPDRELDNIPYGISPDLQTASSRLASVGGAVALISLQVLTMPIGERRNDILTFIVDDYIASGYPVSSGQVADESGLHVSSATIRTEMGWLREAGYLIRPHTSSGAIPTAEGYRHFVAGLEELSPPPGLSGLFLDADNVMAEDMDGWVRMASAVMADLVGALAFITSPRFDEPAVRSIELVGIRDLLIMLIIVLQGAEVFRSIIETEREYDASEIDRARNLVTEKVAGRKVPDLVTNETEPDARLQDPLCAQVWDATLTTLRGSASLPGRRHVSGYSKMLAEPELVSDPELGVLAMEVIEDDASFGALVSGVNEADSPIVEIGNSEVRGGMENLSVIMCSYGGDDVGQGVVGLMSPLRVHYGRAIPVVHYTAQRLGTFAQMAQSTPSA